MNEILKYRKAFIWIMMAFSFLALTLIWNSSTGLEGGQDSYMHYLFSRYSWSHPHLFLDQWGKPVFTLLSSPFSQLGINGLVLFNLFCLLFTGYYSYKICKSLSVSIPELAFVFVVFAPIAFGRSISGLTEPLNALLVALMLFFFVKDKNKWAYIIASFLPFVRTEGFVILGVVMLYLLIKRHFKFLPYILSGTLFFSVLGAVISGDILWVINDNPYFQFEAKGELELEKGDFLHYVNNMKSVWTAGLLIVGTLGALVFSVKWLQNKGNGNKVFLVVLCFGIFIVYLLAHSTVYYLGIIGAQGLLRVLLVTVPCLAILAACFIGEVFTLFNNRLVKLVLFIGISFYMVVSSYRVNNYSFPWQDKVSISPEHISQNLKNAIAYLKENNLEDRMLVHQLPLIDVYANKDPFIYGAEEDAQSSNIWNVLSEDDWLKDEHIVVWDGYHAPREGGVSLEFMQQNKRYKFLKKFEDENSKHFKGHFDLYLFLKIKKSQ